MVTPRPRPQVISLTDAAAERIKYVMANAAKPVVGVRVGVKNGGCAGMTYTMEYAEDVAKTDEVVEDKGVRVLIDPKAVLFLLGTQMDYKTDKLSAQFVFNNPNQTSACGCGESVQLKPAAEAAPPAVRRSAVGARDDIVELFSVFGQDGAPMFGEREWGWAATAIYARRRDVRPGSWGRRHQAQSGADGTCLTSMLRARRPRRLYAAASARRGCERCFGGESCTSDAGLRARRSRGETARKSHAKFIRTRSAKFKSSATTTWEALFSAKCSCWCAPFTACWQGARTSVSRRPTGA